MLLVVTRYRVPPGHLDEFLDVAREALRVLAERTGFVRGHVGQAIDEAGLMVLSSEWENVGSYRRALSSYEVKLTAVPLLSRAIDEPTAFEILHSRGPEGVRDSPSALSPGAATYNLGES